MFERVTFDNRRADLTHLLAIAPMYRNHSFFSWKRIFYNAVTGWIISCVALLTILFLFAQWTIQVIESNSIKEQQYIRAQEDAQRKIEERNLRIQKLVSLETSGVVRSVRVGTVISGILDTASGPQREYLARVIPEAVKIGVAFSIPPSGIVGMSVYESNYGTSDLATQYQNYLGMKALPSRWDGAIASKMPTVDLGKHVKADFRAYTDLGSCILGFAEFLRETGRYDGAFLTTNGVDFVNFLHKQGYCPDNDYVQHVSGIIDRHNLAVLDPLARELNAESAYPAIKPQDGTLHQLVIREARLETANP